MYMCVCYQIKRAVHGSAIHASSSFLKLGVPSPVTGSHPGAATNPKLPCGPHAKLSPSVMSLKTPENAFEYS